MNFIPGDRIYIRHQIGRYTVIRQTGRIVIYRCQTWPDDRTDRASAIDCKRISDAHFPTIERRPKPYRLDHVEISGTAVDRSPGLEPEHTVH